MNKNPSSPKPGHIAAGSKPGGRAITGTPAAGAGSPAAGAASPAAGAASPAAGAAAPGARAARASGAERAARAGLARGAAGHSWKGEAVEEPDAAGPAESPEDGASRAEGNAPVAAQAATEVNAAAPGTYDWKHPPRPDADLDDDAARRENEEEKRQSAAEEHAADSPKHAPHGRL